MNIERKKDLSIYYWLIDKFSDAPYINIQDGFPVSNLVIPTISIDGGVINLEPHEMGNKNQVFVRIWRIDVFADNKSIRDEYSYRILGELQDNIPVYDYDEGFPPSVSPTQLGCLQASNIKMTPVQIFPELTEKLYFRASVTFTAKYNKF